MPRRPPSNAPTSLGSRVEALLTRILGTAAIGPDEQDAHADQEGGPRSNRRASLRAGQKRTIAGIAFVGVLAAASLYYVASSRGDAPQAGSKAGLSPAPTRPSMRQSASTTTPASTDRLRSIVAGSQSCSDVV